MQHWTWARACCRGVSHIRQGTRRQDALSCLAANHHTLVAVVCDGAGSASYGGEGASLAVRCITRHALEHLRTVGTLPEDELIWSWTDHVRDLLGKVSAKHGLERKNFASTLVSVIATPTQTIAFHIGDGAAVGRVSSTQTWETLTWPEQGEYASTTYFLTDEPSVRLRISRPEHVFDAIAVFTDGIERLALSFADSKPYEPFFTGIIKPVEQSSVMGCDLPLSQKLATYLDSPAINERTDDDKSLIIASLR